MAAVAEGGAGGVVVMGKVLWPHGATGAHRVWDKTEAWGSRQSSMSAGPPGTPEGGDNGSSCKPGSPCALPALLLSHTPHATPTGAGVGEGQVSRRGVGAKCLGHVGATAPSHPSHSPKLSGGQAASRRREPSRHTTAIRLDLVLP